jgi:putative PEP-CTERM system histidine kinase
VLGLVAYGVSAGLALVVLVWLLVASRNHDLVRRAAMVCVAVSVWAGVLAASVSERAVLGWAVFGVDAIRYAAMLVFVRALAQGNFPRWLHRVGLGLSAALLMFAFGGGLAGGSAVWAAAGGPIYGTAGLLLAFVGLVATEQVLRTGDEERARSLRWCAVGVGGPFAYDLFLFSQAHLLGALDPAAWALRGLIGGALLVPLAYGVRGMPPAPAQVFISRHVVFYSSAFVAVGLYLCLMAIGGYYVREKGGDWGNALQVLFLFGAGTILASLLLAESPLRRVRVFIATHFYRYKYDYRIEWLRFVQTLSSSDESDIRRTAIRAVAQIFASPGGILVMRDDDTGVFNLEAAWPASNTAPLEYAAVSADDPLPRFLQTRQWVIDVRELAERPELYGDLQLPPWLPTAGPWRVIAPLLVVNRLIGFLVLRAPPEPFTMNFEDRDLLKTVGRNVAVQLAQRQADERLAQSRQFDAYNRFAAFVMHDLKNGVAQLQLLVANAARHRNNPEFVEDAIGTIRNTAERMTQLIGQLQSRDVHGTARVVDLTGIARAAVARSQARAPQVVMTGGETSLPVHADPDRLGSVLDHVIRNAQDATATDGKVTLSLEAQDESARLRVIDEGSGMDADFVHNRLFRPFDSTKGAKGMGIGAYQAREYVRSVGGDVEVQSAPGRGTVFSIRLTLCKTTNSDSPVC